MKFEINLNQFLQKCNSKDVISFGHENWLSVERIRSTISQALHNNVSNYMTKYILEILNFNNNQKNYGIIQSLFFQGTECEILKAGSQGWQKGKLKINVTLEFIPDEPEVEQSLLDDIRQAEINNNK